MKGLVYIASLVLAITNFYKAKQIYNFLAKHNFFTDPHTNKFTIENIMFYSGLFIGVAFLLNAFLQYKFPKTAIGLYLIIAAISLQSFVLVKDAYRSEYAIMSINVVLCVVFTISVLISYIRSRRVVNTTNSSEI
ncbi:hypothetical protein [Paenibacillus sp. FSL H8-0034]|uniref:hypothetical protein n=1 Tax=Paenibacillus sp. FSL H8-0034 TaxID=2954671 RepID=UPI0030FBB81B